MARYKTTLSEIKDRFYTGFMQHHQGKCLSGSSLAYFVRNMSLSGLEEIIQVPCSTVQKVQPCDSERIKVNLPMNAGEELDRFSLDWYNWPQWTNAKEVKFVPKTCNGEFFNPERKKNGHELIAKLLKCGEEAGIRKKMFLAFGNLLGRALVSDFLWNDDDIDMCILADDIPQEQLRSYLTYCMRDGLCEGRMHGPEMINKKYVWFSLGDRPIGQNGVKACNWFWFKHGGYYWHSKGAKWNPKYSAKGIPLSIFDGTLIETYFGPNRIKVPEKVGSCLDWWYGQWMEEKNESSHAVVTMKIVDEENKKTWVIDRGDV